MKDWQLNSTQLSNNEYLCKICNTDILYSMHSIISHYWRVHTTEGKNHVVHIDYKNRKLIPWNKGLSCKTDDRVKRNTDAVKKFYETHEASFKGKHHSDETKMKLSKSGGYRRGSGNGIKGWYKGFWCDSSWELAYIIYCLDNNIQVRRNTEKFEYIFNNKIYSYIPDYIVNDNYVEIKGYTTKRWESKKEQFPYNLTVIGKNEMIPIFEYVINKYGKKYTRLYESNTKEVSVSRKKMSKILCEICNLYISSNGILSHKKAHKISNCVYCQSIIVDNKKFCNKSCSAKYWNPRKNKNGEIA